MAELERVLNEDLNKLSIWAKRWLTIFNPQKTEVMAISNIHSENNLQFKYDGIFFLDKVDKHKHLGLIISSNNNWTNHIDSILISASKQVNYLRKLKYQLPRTVLNKLYCTYIRPLLEYASEVCDGCNETDANRLEQIQLNAARIVTGLPIFASLNSLYFESGWEALAQRRKTKNLTLMYKIINEETPTYLRDLLPNTAEDRSGYTLRSSNNYTIPFARLSAFQSSFIPSTLRLWNGLSNEVRLSQTLPQFKRKVRRHEIQVMDHLLVGDRKSNILLTRIRHRCSSLNADLFSVNIVP